MQASDNFSKFSELLDKHLYFTPAGFGEGYDNKFTRYSQLYVIVNMFLVDFFRRGIHDNNVNLSKIKEFNSLFLNIDSNPITLGKELEIIDFLLSLDVLEDLRR